jgi:microcystin-dependent protein
MAQPYVGEIRMFAGNFQPVGWLFCEGQLLPISENETLFQLIGTMYGGDGQSTFALPDLRGRIPIHFGNGPDAINYPQTQAAGVEEVTLSVQQIPVHTHAALATTALGNSPNAAGALLAQPNSTQPGILFYGTDSPVNMNAAMIQPAGGSQPHTNFMPYLCVNFIISLFGIFPTPT